jgi:hypothetical protein
MPFVMPNTQAGERFLHAMTHIYKPRFMPPTNAVSKFAGRRGYSRNQGIVK